MSKFREKYVYGWFTPPEIGRDLIYLPGGNNWQGSAFNPNTQTLFVPSESIPYKIKVIVKSKEKDNSYQNLKHFSLYQNKCSSCHGTNRNGEYVKSNGLDIKEKFIPSLVGLSIYEGLSKKLTSIDMLKNQHKFMDKFDLSKNEFDNIKDLFGEWDKKLETNKEIFFTSETSLADLDDGSLMTKPPWGTITSINIINGKTNWVKPYGFKDNNEIGTFNAGGVSVTSTNLIIGTGTLDKFVSIINASDGKTLWKYKLDVEGTAAPLIYNFEGKTYIAIFASGGLKPNSERGSFLYIFGVK